jgi:hypothetical protein
MADEAPGFGRQLAWAAALALAGAMFLVGLIAPLTPSEGRPDVPAVAVFAGVPAALALWVAVSARRGAVLGARRASCARSRSPASPAGCSSPSSRAAV